LELELDPLSQLLELELLELELSLFRYTKVELLPLPP